MSTHINLDELCRTEATCRGCGEIKQVGLVLCWTCFKYRKDVTPFKYSSLPLGQWLAKAGKGQNVAGRVAGAGNGGIP